LAQQQYSNAIKLAQKPCVDVYVCGEKVEKITTTIQALEQQRALYQDDPEQRRRIVDQEASLLRNLTPKEITQARLASADQSTMLDALVLTKVPAAVADLVTALTAGGTDKIVLARTGTLAGKQVTNSTPLGLGSTGRTVANSLNEQLAMKAVMSDPVAGTVVPMRRAMTDSRWPGSEGWVKMTQNVNGVEIHYVRNVRTGAVDDFKFK
ncbi:MAG: hypothetical protein P4L87_18960, partial [Formivibrio sp.]|nr:hypothetical protein [Formivibrio sp.]